MTRWPNWFRWDASTQRRWLLRAALALGLGSVTVLIFALSGTNYLTRLGLDLLFPLRSALAGPAYAPQESRTAVILLDEETYQREPFRSKPKVAWTPYLAEVMNAVGQAQASVVGLDVVFPTTLDQPDLKPGYDRPFLRALRSLGQQQGLLLGQVELSKHPIRPTQRQILAGGGSTNLASLRLQPDVDDVVRRYRTGFRNVDGSRTPTLATELVRRAGHKTPEKPFLINFNAGGAQARVFSLADLYACSQQNRKDFFREHFKDRIVLIGTGLDVEDRHLTSQRLANVPVTAQDQARCVLEQNRERFGAKTERRTMPGVMIHAAAAETLMRDAALAQWSAPKALLVVGVLTTLLALALFAFNPATGILVLVAVAGLETAGGTLAFLQGLVPPLPGLALGWPIAYAGVYSFRFGLEEREKRRIRHAFQHYLSPALVDRLAADPEALRLGGQAQRVTVLFADIAGYTTLSERLADQPEALVAQTNEYLSRIVECIETHNGYVDKFMGDAVMAVWGAPINDEDQARQAVDAALEALNRFDDTDEVHIRIGINTGIAVAGNMGAARRFNYTVTGDPVNLAARLEAANKYYFSTLLVGENTAAALPDDYVLKPLDSLKVKGKHKAVSVYEVLGPNDTVSDETQHRVERFRQARELYLQQHFDEAEAAFQELASERDEQAPLYVQRCQYLRQNPPRRDWDGTYSLETK
jgi:adenylate cyclase